MANLPKIPDAGCIVEYLEDNSVQIAVVIEAVNGRLRLLLPSRRETKLAQNRVLPWIGPRYSPSLSREEYVRILEEHKKEREEKAATIPLEDLWELSQGEIGQAEAHFFAELMESAPDENVISAYGRAMLGCKTNFRFQPPNFIVFPKEMVEKRLEEQKNREEKEAFVAGGGAFLRFLWDVACKKKSLPVPDDIKLDEKMYGRIENFLFQRMRNPDSLDNDALWQLLSKGLPDVPHLPLQLLTAWGKLPQHYNFWLDRADYEPGDNWWQNESQAVRELAQSGQEASARTDLVSLEDLPFLSIDSDKTCDIDDAFHIRQTPAGWTLLIALACPALAWPFGESLDKLVLHRGTSLYLPEATMHMLPEILGKDAFSLLAGRTRIAFCLKMELDAEGAPVSCEPLCARVKLAANLHYDDVQAVLENDHGLPDNPAAEFKEQLEAANSFSLMRERLRIADGAIIMRRPSQQIILEDDQPDPKVSLVIEEESLDAQRLVSEMMVLASSAFANWAFERNIPILFRTQNVTLPREYAGIWSRPEDLSKIMRAMVPSLIEIDPKPHSALAVSRYAPITSPLRRYTDLLNEAQALYFLAHGKSRWSREEMLAILDSLLPVLEAAGHVQRFRPRYWLLLYFRQQGDKVWWDGVITDENENFVTVSLPAQGLFTRGRRNLFQERCAPGMAVRLRLGKVNPLYNEIQILEAAPAE